MSEQCKTKALFVISDTPYDTLDIENIERGLVPLSGTHSSFLLVTHYLSSQNGLEIGLFILSGKKIKSERILSFQSLEEAISWKEQGQLILCTADDERALNKVSAFGNSFFLWLHVHLNHRLISQLESKLFSKLICVSDTVRLTGLHSHKSNDLMRIYNPLNPHFINYDKSDDFSRETKSLVFSGFIGENKGVHHLLLLWPKIKEHDNEFKLYIAGSGKLYDSNAKLGSLGIASSEFENKYLVPLLEHYGSFENAGIHFLGSLKPCDLKSLYTKCSIGIVNLNQWESTETFCCTGIEMIASGLKVVCLDKGALKETIGIFTLANLISVKDLANLPEILTLISKEEVNSVMQSKDAELIKERYSLSTVGNEWARLLRKEETRSEDKWNAPKGKRYYIEKLVSAFQLSKLYRLTITFLKR
ncbi:glycosyltransferase [Alteromonas sp. BMJM2]|uniref:glycosyltransferase n=1 Tax=Alteromonas sp. BMJM2 TaxID=2954241 RepID=UPI0022B5D48F|nr:glycosyltransferase [Alteromonas sp. BMJM2]